MQPIVAENSLPPYHPEPCEGSLLNIVNISIEILRLRRPAGGSAQDDTNKHSYIFYNFLRVAK